MTITVTAITTSISFSIVVSIGICSTTQSCTQSYCFTEKFGYGPFVTEGLLNVGSYGAGTNVANLVLLRIIFSGDWWRCLEKQRYKRRLQRLDPAQETSRRTSMFCANLHVQLFKCFCLGYAMFYSSTAYSTAGTQFNSAINTQAYVR